MFWKWMIEDPRPDDIIGEHTSQATRWIGANDNVSSVTYGNGRSA